jgi:hypothetical protein
MIPNAIQSSQIAALIKRSKRVRWQHVCKQILPAVVIEVIGVAKVRFGEVAGLLNIVLCKRLAGEITMQSFHSTRYGWRFENSYDADISPHFCSQDMKQICCYLDVPAS